MIKIEEGKIRKQILKLRLMSSLKQTTLAGMMDISQSSYNKLESGSSGLSFRRFIVFCHVLDVHPMDFINSVLTKQWRHSEYECNLCNEIKKLQENVKILQKQNLHFQNTINILLQKPCCRMDS